MSTRHHGWICVLCLSLVSGFAQQSRPTGQSEPLGSANDHPITLDVVVTDKSGRPLPGLQRHDFTLLDNKQPQKIVSFHAVESGTATADPPVEVVLLVDEVNAPFSVVAFERHEIEKFLGRDGGKLARPVSMVFLSDSGTSMGNTSQDGNVLIAYLHQEELGLRTTGNRSQGFYGAEDRLRLSARALEQLAYDEAAKPGRKLMVWIGPGWPLFPGQDAMTNLEDRQKIFNSVIDFSYRLQQARITLYDIDPRGPEEDELLMSTYKQFLGAVRTARQAQIGNLGLQVLAYQSGGRVFNSNDVAGGIATCVADASSFYVLSFDGGPAGDGPNEYHALEIKIDRPGLVARTRSGYYAKPEHQR